MSLLRSSLIIQTVMSINSLAVLLKVISAVHVSLDSAVLSISLISIICHNTENAFTSQPSVVHTL